MADLMFLGEIRQIPHQNGVSSSLKLSTRWTSWAPVYSISFNFVSPHPNGLRSGTQVDATNNGPINSICGGEPYSLTRNIQKKGND
jgi:hypothetical protein